MITEEDDDKKKERNINETRNKIKTIENNNERYGKSKKRKEMYYLYR